MKKIEIIKKLGLLSCLILTLTTIQSQDIINYYEALYQGDLLEVKGEIDSAIIVYEKAFNQVKYVHSPLLHKVLRMSKKVNDKKRIKQYKTLIKQRKKCPDQNKFLLEKVDSLLKIDQKQIRIKKYILAANYMLKCEEDSNCDSSSDEYKTQSKLFYEWEASFEKNANHLLLLFDEYGYLGEEKIGFDNFYKVIVMLFHYEADTNNVILGSYLRKALYDNKLLPTYFTLILDRHLQATTGAQKYWTWNVYEKKTQPNFTKDQKQAILKLREEIGIFGSDFWFEYNKSKQIWYLRNKYLLFR